MRLLIKGEHVLRNARKTFGPALYAWCMCMHGACVCMVHVYDTARYDAKSRRGQFEQIFEPVQKKLFF